MLLQNPNDLLFRIQALLHRQLPHSIYERTPNSNGRYFRGQVTGLVTPDEVGDPQSPVMWLDVDGKRMQEGSTRTMVFPVAFLISY
jgi:hypothetical protein